MSRNIFIIVSENQVTLDHLCLQFLSKSNIFGVFRALVANFRMNVRYENADL